MIKSKQTFFTAISVYQALLQLEYSKNFIFSDLKLFYKHKEEISKELESSNKKSILIIEINEEVNENFLQMEGNFQVILISNSNEFDNTNLN